MMNMNVCFLGMCKALFCIECNGPRTDSVQDGPNHSTIFGRDRGYTSLHLQPEKILVHNHLNLNNV